MDLYHLHLLGVKDRLYKPNSELIVDPKKFNNRLYDRIYNSSVCVSGDVYKLYIQEINELLHNKSHMTLGDTVNLGEIINYLLYKRGFIKDELIRILQDAQSMLLAAGTNYRELAMEEYRKENCPDKPSRLHSLYGCTEEGTYFWINNIFDGDLDIYRIEPLEEPFVSNEALLPYEGLSFGDKVKASYKYFHPSKKDLDGFTDEYLIQGKVKILEKVGEVRSK